MTDRDLAAARQQDFAAALLDAYTPGSSQTAGDIATNLLAHPLVQPYLPDGGLRPHERLILAAENLLEQFGTRTERGEKLTAEWGEPDERGWYTPIFTVHYDDVLTSDVDLLSVRDIAAELVGGWRNGFPTYTGDNEPAVIDRLEAAIAATRSEG